MDGREAVREEKRWRRATNKGERLKIRKWWKEKDMMEEYKERQSHFQANACFSSFFCYSNLCFRVLHYVINVLCVSHELMLHQVFPSIAFFLCLKSYLSRVFLTNTPVWSPILTHPHADYTKKLFSPPSSGAMYLCLLYILGFPCCLASSTGNCLAEENLSIFHSIHSENARFRSKTEEENLVITDGLWQMVSKCENLKREWLQNWLCFNQRQLRGRLKHTEVMAGRARQERAELQGQRQHWKITPRLLSCLGKFPALGLLKCSSNFGSHLKRWPPQLPANSVVEAPLMSLTHHLQLQDSINAKSFIFKFSSVQIFILNITASS